MSIPLRGGNVRASGAGTLSGFTLIELMIVVAIIAIILTLALPVYQNYSIRAKMGESLSVAAAAKTSVASTCVENPLLTGLTNYKVGYNFETSSWVETVEVSGDCTAPIITAATRNTGAPGDPDIILTGNFTDSSARISWVCSSPAENYLLPRECRTD